MIMAQVLSVASLLTTSVLGHMALVDPAPRRSAHHPGYAGGIVDYDITSPLGGHFSFPCRGAPAGPVYKSYKAGSSIPISIAGSAKHMGGHCQFSMTYDEVNFAVLKTVYGNCIIDSVEYEVPIPRDAPSGNVTLAWTWFNKIGNREMYMNCVDINIEGTSSTQGKITGKKMVVANLPGYPTFPEGFSNDYGKDLYESQPVITITPPRSPKVTSPPASQPAKPTPTSRPTNRPPPPPSTTPKPTANPASCIEGGTYCQNGKVGKCINQKLKLDDCYIGTTCRGRPGAAECR